MAASMRTCLRFSGAWVLPGLGCAALRAALLHADVLRTTIGRDLSYWLAASPHTLAAGVTRPRLPFSRASNHASHRHHSLTHAQHIGIPHLLT